MMCIDATTYGESVSSTPSIGSDAVNGPMQYGMTYIVRPRMQLRNRPVRTPFISSGSSQLFVIPASPGSLATDEGAVFDPRDIRRVRTTPERIRLPIPG